MRVHTLSSCIRIDTGHSSMLSMQDSWIKTVAVRAWNSAWSKTPAKFRRMTVLSSLYAVMTKCDESDKERLSSLNENLKLTRDVDCMRFAVLIAPRWWRKRLHSQPSITERTSIDTYARYLARSIPCWLRYGEDDEVREDLRQLLHHCQREATLA